MSFIFISTFLIFTGFLFYYASKSQPLSFDLDQLPDFVKQLAKEAYQEGRTVMSPNDKGQIESYTNTKWVDLNIIQINSVWIQEIDRLKCLTQMK